MPSSKELFFKGPYLRQNWSLPDSIIYSITKNPSNSKAWQKLIQSCKYFFFKNPNFVIRKLSFHCNGKWEISLNKVKIQFSGFTNISCKFWLTYKFDICSCNSTPETVSSLISRLYRCDVKKLILDEQNISFNEFLFLTSNVENIKLRHVIVKNEEGSIVPLEKLVKVLPKIKEFEFYDNFNSSCISKNTVKKLLEISHFSKINEFALFNIPESIDIKEFWNYIKKNKFTKFTFYFQETISEGYKNRVDEIIEAESHDYKIPKINFKTISGEKWEKMVSLLDKHK
uniref:Uncharacterized protein n=1 Tax=Panagrolaimus davidi TaxID=227884 RepID=A0A914PUS2_9BILA